MIPRGRKVKTISSGQYPSARLHRKRAAYLFIYTAIGLEEGVIIRAA